MGKFVENMSNLNKPLRDIIKDENKFEWTSSQQSSFDKLKLKITSDPILQHFDVNKPITISVDSSSYGLGATILQDDKPCAYASKALTDTQQRYAQIEKELLAICFGLERFHQFTFGQRVTVETDHKPLLGVFKKPLNSCPARLQRMLLSLQKYQINLVYKPGKNLIIADVLSRANLNEHYNESYELEGHVCLIESKVVFSDEKMKEMLNATENDTELQKIKHYTINGWPNSISKISVNLKHFYKLRSEITVGNNNLLYLNQRLIIPSVSRSLILKNLHTGHVGISKSVVKAQNTVYWPGINNDIESYIKKCDICNKYSNSNTKRPMIVEPIVKQPGVMDFDRYNALIDAKHNKARIQYNSRGVRNSNTFRPGEFIHYQESPKSLWKKGKIDGQVGVRSYRIQNEEGRFLIRNEVYLKKRLNKDNLKDNLRSSINLCMYLVMKV